MADDHRVVAQCVEPLAVTRPQPLWSEQLPDDWWAALDRALLRLASEAPMAMGAVRAIGLSGQMHGAVLLDRDDAVLRPAILWNDGRSSAQCNTLLQRLPALPAIAGNLPMPGFTSPKLLWVREREPDVFRRLRRVLLPKDWLRLQLTGDAVTDCSDASGTLWLDVAQRRWSEPLLLAGGLTLEHMPTLVEGSAPAGTLRPRWTQRWGLPPNVVVAGGAGDNAASAVGMGAIEPGDGFVSLGTSGVIFLCTDRFLPHPQAAVHAFCHALPARWHQMSVMLSAASALHWAVRLTGRSDEAALLAEVAALPASAQAVAPLCLPYLSGERTPHNDAQAQGVLFGLTHEHGAASLGYAVMEGVAFGLLDGWSALDGTQRASAPSLSLVGGGARSAWWAQLLASALGLPLVLREAADAGAALGAARLGWLAHGGPLTTVCRTQAERRRFEPDAAQRDLLLARYRRFKALYPVLRGSFTPVSG